jgi:UDP-N-acetylmuramoyl-tripeptide--D-alanyl-D-alanine ligase
MKKIIKKLIQCYLKFLSKITISRYKPDIIAVAGSTGKHPIKEGLNDLLQNEFKVRMAPKKYNAELGIPLAIFGLVANSSKINVWLKIITKATQITLFSKDFPQKIILEIGISHPKDIDYFLSLIRPQITILTDINAQYLDNFGDLDKIALEYKKLIQNTKKNGLILLNCDDLRIKELYMFSDAKTMCYGQNKGSDIKISDIKSEDNKQLFTVDSKEGQTSHSMEKFGIHHARAKAVKEAVKNYYKII